MQDLQKLYPDIIAWLREERPGAQGWDRKDIELALAWRGKITDDKTQRRHLQWMLELGFLVFEQRGDDTRARYYTGPRMGGAA